MATTTSTLNPPIAAPTIIPVGVFVGKFPAGGELDTVAGGGGDSVGDVVELVGGGGGDVVELVGGGGDTVVLVAEGAGAVALVGGGGEVALVDGDGADIAGEQ